MATRHGSATVTLPSDTEILITRSFEAPRPLVWDLLTTPRHLLRWWGPDWCPMTSCEVDLRPGGRWRYVAHDAAGTEFAWHGTYLHIERPYRLTSTEVYEGFPDTVSTNTTTLTEHDGVTTLQTLVRHTSREHRDGHVQSGMEGGMQITMNRLDDLAHRSASTSERFRRVAGTFTDRVLAVAPHQWDLPAPCEGWVARDVVRHLVDWVPSVLDRAGLAIATGASVDDDPAGAWTALATTLQEALDDPAVAGRSFDAGPPGTMTVEQAIGMLVVGDVLVHTWDLAVATGQDTRVDEVIAAEMLAGMQPLDAMLRASGHFGPAVAVAGDATVQDRLIAFTGRDPRPVG